MSRSGRPANIATAIMAACATSTRTIEARAAGRRAGRDPKLFPVPLGRVAQLLDGRAEHVVGDAHLAVGEHDALGRDRAVREIAALAVELGERVEHFLEHEHRGAPR